MADMTHSHPEDRTDVHPMDVTCKKCGTVQSFAVPDDHDGSRIRWSCNNCGAEDWTEGFDPAARILGLSDGGGAVVSGEAGAGSAQ